MAAHPRIGSPLYAGEIAGLQSGVATNEPPLLPNNILVLLFRKGMTTSIYHSNLVWVFGLDFYLPQGPMERIISWP
jgi:hypothetical protein